MMKRLVFIVVLLLPSLAQSAGSYDGVYLLERESHKDYLTVHQSGALMIIGWLDSLDDSWSALIGPIDGDFADLDLIYPKDSEGEAAVTVVFHGDGSATIEIFSCSPVEGRVCDVETGQVFTINKIF